MLSRSEAQEGKKGGHLYPFLPTPIHDTPLPLHIRTYTQRNTRMLSATIAAWRKKVPLMGYSRGAFFKKVKNPRASKPWRDRAITVGGSVDVVANSDVIDEEGRTLLGSLTTAGPLGMRSPQVSPADASAAAQNSLRLSGPYASLSSSREFAPPLLQVPHGTDTAVAAFNSSEALSQRSVSDGEPRMAIGPLPSSSTNSVSTTTTLPFGKTLDLHVQEVDTNPATEPTPLHLQAFHRRSRREVADSILLPRNINKLFHKIMGWSKDLVEMDETSLQMEREGERGGTASSNAETPQVLRQKMSRLTDKMKYGVLLDTYEKDRFAVEHQLEVAGEKMERKLLEWEGVHVLDQDATQQMTDLMQHKASFVMDAPSSFHVPVVNQDCCPGCGAQLQNRSDEEFGYVRPGEIEKYVMLRNNKTQVRHEYAARMAELQAHWEKHGRQVGEEWLDFMTQEEFDAFYRDTNHAFVCHRCHALENLGVNGRRKVWSAPDFTEQLKALKEKKCVVVLVVDVTDFPGSMVYDLPGLVSMNNSVIIAVNKMDCIRTRSFKYSGRDKAVAACLVSESYVRRWVRDIATQFGLPRHQIKGVVPLSAKRGWGIESLISSIEDAANLNLRRPSKPLPTYFVGVANVGKSSVINAIAHALYVPQPPHPQSKKIYYTKLNKEGKENVLWRWYTPPNVNQAEMLDIPSRRDKKASKLLTVSSLPGTTVAVNAVSLSLTPGKRRGGGPNAETTEGTSYFYDTPGLLPHWHQQSPLTLLQMRRTLIRKHRNPQCFILLPGHTLFLGGLAAVDIVRGPSRGLLFMVYTSQKVRNAIVNTADSDAFWQEQLGKLLDPPGSLEQLLPTESLSAGGRAASLSEVKSYLFECYNRHRRRPKADIYICGLGWTSFCVSEASDVVLRVRTLPGVVHGVREPLRHKDLRAFRAWPKLRRRFTSKGLEDRDTDVDNDSISTVVRLVSEPVPPAADVADGSSSPSTDSQGMRVTVVTKEPHPHTKTSSSAPFAALKDDLHAAGKL